MDLSPFTKDILHSMGILYIGDLTKKKPADLEEVLRSGENMLQMLIDLREIGQDQKSTTAQEIPRQISKIKKELFKIKIEKGISVKGPSHFFC